MNRSVGIMTLGCKVNAYESDYVIKELKKKGYQIKDFKDFCDIYIINTCSVTNTSDIKSRKMIRSAKRRNPDACVIAMGCFIENNKELDEEGISIYLGTKEKSKIVDLIEEYYQEKKVIRNFPVKEKEVFEDMYIEDFSSRTRAFVKIEDGCENFCSYCIIPYVRGKCRSKKKERVLEEITALIEAGYKEIVLTGINTGRYGKDLGTNLSSLIKEIVKIKGLKRLRISSIEMTEIDEEFLELLKKHSNITSHLHIPLQSGSNHILRLMNRKYQIEEFEKKLKEIRKIRPEIVITTDIIVGFPEESEEDFENTIEVAKKLEFAKIHVFPYSERSGTVAATMHQIDGNIRKERARKLLKLSKELEHAYYEKFLGKEKRVLIEQEKEGYSYGHTENYIHVKIKKKLKKNKEVMVKLERIEDIYMIGDVV